MNVLLSFTASTGFIILILNGPDAFIPSHVSSREDVKSVNENSTYNERYRYALKLTLDLLWNTKVRIIQSKELHRRVTIFDGCLIEYIDDILDDQQRYLNLLGEIITVVLEGPERIRPWDRFNPVNETVMDKVLADWRLMKSHIDYYKPNKAWQAYHELQRLVNSTTYELPLQYEPIREMMQKLHSETPDMHPGERAREAEETTIISLYY